MVATNSLSLASSLSWFSKEPLVLEKLQYTPLFFKSGLVTTWGWRSICGDGRNWIEVGKGWKFGEDRRLWKNKDIKLSGLVTASIHDEIARALLGQAQTHGTNLIHNPTTPA